MCWFAWKSHLNFEIECVLLLSPCVIDMLLLLFRFTLLWFHLIHPPAIIRDGFRLWYVVSGL